MGASNDTNTKSRSRLYFSYEEELEKFESVDPVEVEFRFGLLRDPGPSMRDSSSLVWREWKPSLGDNSYELWTPGVCV